MKRLLLLPILALLVSCSGLMYSAQSFQMATDIKAEAAIVISHSTDSFQRHTNEVGLLKAHVESAYQHERTRKLNHATIAMWSEVIKSNGNLFALLELWEAKYRLTGAMKVESSRQIERLLNSIIDLEAHKK